MPATETRRMTQPLLLGPTLARPKRGSPVADDRFRPDGDVRASARLDLVGDGLGGEMRRHLSARALLRQAALVGLDPAVDERRVQRTLRPLNVIHDRLPL